MSLPLHVLPTTRYDDKLKKSFIHQLSLHVELNRELSSTVSPPHIVIFQPQGGPNDEFDGVVQPFLGKGNSNCRNIILFTAFATSQRYGRGFTPDCVSRFKYTDKLFITSGHLDTQVNKSTFERLGDILVNKYEFKVTDDQSQLGHSTGSDANSQVDKGESTGSDADSQVDKGKSTGSDADSQVDKGKSTGSDSDSQVDKGKSTGSDADSHVDKGKSTGSDADSQVDKGKSTGSDADSHVDKGKSTGSDVDRQMDKGKSTGSDADSHVDKGKSTGSDVDSHVDKGKSTGSDADSHVDKGKSAGSDADGQVDEIKSTGTDSNSHVDRNYSTRKYADSQVDRDHSTVSKANSQGEKGHSTGRDANIQVDNTLSSRKDANSQAGNPETGIMCNLGDINRLRMIQQDIERETTDLQRKVEKRFALPPGKLLRILEAVMEYLDHRQEAAATSEIKERSRAALRVDVASEIEKQLELHKGSVDKIITSLLKVKPEGRKCVIF